MKRRMMAIAMCFLLGTAGAVSQAGAAGAVSQAGAAEWTWFERDALPVEGRGFTDTEAPYCRLPLRAKGVVRGPVWGMSHNATGMYLRFKTGANRIALRWKVANEHPDDPLIPQAGSMGVDVYRFDAAARRWRFAGNKRYWSRANGTNVAGRAEFAWRPGEAGLIYLPTRSYVLDFRVGLPAGQTLEPYPHAAGHEKPVVHYGTSIVHGGCASRPGLTYTAIAARALDRNYINLGFSGNGRMETELAPFMAEIDAAVYLVDCAWNMGPDLIAQNGIPFLEALKKLRPDTPILLCEGCTQEARPPARNTATRQVYDTLKRADPARWANLYYFSADEMFPPDDDELTHDFCHPNDYGSLLMGPAYATRIREVLEADAAHRAGVAAPTVDFAAATGPVRPVNGVGQPPMLGATDTRLFHYLKEAGIPYARLHDVGGRFGGNLFVDIPNLFRDFDADETKPESYDFHYTDILMKGLEQNGVEPYFRLGVTIENAAGQGHPYYRIVPPKDYAKWARICEHVIRHYTEGWANGYRMKISHWEIWNEPDSFETIPKSSMWKAPFGEYVKLYNVAAAHLKAKFPHLMIGGYASCGVYAVASSWGKPENPREKHLLNCVGEFLDGVKAAGAPLDFFSFHCYDNPEFVGRQCAWIRAALDARGFARTEMSCNEWLPRPCSNEACGTPAQAAQIAAMLVAFHDAPVADTELYDARCGMGAYSPLFDPVTLKPRKPYHVLRAFNELRKLGTAVKTVDAARDDRLWCLAAASGAKRLVFLANNGPAALPIPEVFGAHAVKAARAVDATHDFTPVATDGTIGAHTVLLLDCGD